MTTRSRGVSPPTPSSSSNPANPANPSNPSGRPSAIAPICGVLRTQLDDVVDVTESAALFLVEHMQRIDEAVAGLGDRIGNLVAATDGKATHAQELGRRNAQVVDELIALVSSHDEAMKALSDEVRSLGSLAQSISAIARVTNILALNAMIEAARAGEAGRGFQVVAEEVRTLSQQSDHAASRIQAGIAQLTARMEAALGGGTDPGGEGEAGDGAGSGRELAARMAAISAGHHELLEGLTGGAEGMREMVNEVGEWSVHLATVTTEVAGAAQFQDIARQQLAHVGAGLDLIRRYDEAQSAGPDSPEGRQMATAEKALDDFFQEYVMHRQRVAHQRSLGEADGPISEGPAIELF